MVSADRKLKLREIADSLKISEGSVFTILQMSAGKVLASLFWDAHGILFIYYFELGRTINSEYYMALLVRLEEEIAKKRPQMKKKKVLFH